MTNLERSANQLANDDTQCDGGAQEGSSQTSATMQTLAELLSRFGYGEYYPCFNPLAPRRESWLHYRDHAPKKLHSLIDLFILNERVAPTDLAQPFQDIVEPLILSGLLRKDEEDGSVFLPGLVILPVWGNWLICQAPTVNPTLYFGDDSTALLNRLRPKVGGTCLDLCAGPGVQSLHCARFAGQTTAVEVNPAAAWLAGLNVQINGLTERMRVLHGDLYAPVAGQQFDTIVANPPLLPFVEDIAYPFVGHGGADGLRVTRRILYGLPEALTAAGTAQLIGTTLSDGLLPLCSDELTDWAREADMDIMMTLTTQQPLKPGLLYFEGLVDTATVSSGKQRDEVSAAFLESLCSQEASHLCAYFLHVTRGSGAFDLLDVTEGEQPGLWYV